MNRRVGLSPNDVENYKQPAVIISSNYNKQGRFGAADATKNGIWGGSFRIPKTSSSSSLSSEFSGIRFLKRVGTNVTKALRLMSSRNKCSRKVSSAATLARSRSYAEALDDSQRAEAIEDCIEFLNSSSSLQRCNSVASSC
ncbi:hypothetical protein ACH5RR_005236 [Cinchona calisaya]|uniref:Josephin-like protein n=1 Tax=Cinchona calisaya TaxID=153742 RepID=A0ABD3AKM5_9GENT